MTTNKLENITKSTDEQQQITKKYEYVEHTNIHNYVYLYVCKYILAYLHLRK